MSEEKVEETQTIEQEIILDDTALASIVDGVTKGLDAKVEQMVADRMKEIEPVIQKAVGGGDSDDDRQRISSVNTIIGGTNIEKMDVKERFAKHVLSSRSRDYGLLKGFQEYALEAREKAGYNNEGVTTDGQYLVVLPEFEAEIERLLPQYSMINEVDKREINANQVLTNKGTNTIQFYETAEAGVKTGVKTTFGQVRADLRKFAAILPATDELIADSAAEFWSDATSQFAFAYGLQTDTMILTENGTTSTQPIRKGILHTAGINTTVVASSSAITWADLLKAKYAVPTVAEEGGIYVMHRSTFQTLRLLQGSTNYYQVSDSFNGNLGNMTPWGDRIVLTDIMPVGTASGVGTTSGAPVVYGNFSKFARFYQKSGGLDLQYSNEATIHDSANTATNLFEQDMTALRGVWRGTFMTKFPEAFCIIAATPVS